MLTGSLSWDLESPYYSISLRLRRGGCDTSSAKVVALRLHRRRSDGTMDEFNIILKFLVNKRRVSQHQRAGASILDSLDKPKERK